MIRLVVAALLAVAPLVSGCGYSLAGRGSFLPGIKNIGVPPFTNNTPVFDIDRRVTEHVRAELSGRGKYKVFPDRGRQRRRSHRRDHLDHHRAGDVQSAEPGFALRVHHERAVDEDLKSGSPVVESPVQFREEYEPATAGAVADVTTFFGQDVNAYDRIATEFARSVVSALLEAF